MRSNSVMNSVRDLYYNIKGPVHYAPAPRLKTEIARQTTSDSGQQKTPYTIKQIQDWLQSQDTYTLHRPARQHFKRNHYYVYGIDHLWEIDLCDMSMYKKQNDGYTYILTVVDVLTKYAFAKCVKNKSAQSITKAFRDILSESQRRPLVIQCDRGLEFSNSTFRSFLNQHGIKLQFPMTTSRFKCAIVEAFNKTLKQRMFRYFTHIGGKKNSNYRRYIDVLPYLLQGYNNTEHSTTKMKPADVRSEHVPIIYENTHARHRKTDAAATKTQKHSKFRKNDLVRVMRKKSSLFEKGYTEKWSREIFVVDRVIQKTPYPLYVLRDLKNNAIISGKLYGVELQKINLEKHIDNPIRILKSSGLGRGLRYLIEMRDGGKKWINADEL